MNNINIKKYRLLKRIITPKFTASIGNKAESTTLNDKVVVICDSGRGWTVDIDPIYFSEWFQETKQEDEKYLEFMYSHLSLGFAKTLYKYRWTDEDMIEFGSRGSCGTKEHASIALDIYENIKYNKI